MFRNLLRKEPGLLEVRDKLREFQMQRVGDEPNKLRQSLAPIVTILNVIKGPGLVKNGKYVEALDNAEKAMGFEPTAPSSLQLLIQAAEEANFLVLARKTLELACKLHPENYRFVAWLAQIYGKLGMSDDAIERWEKLVKKDPKNEKYKSELERERTEGARDYSDPEDIGLVTSGAGVQSGGKSQEELAKAIKIQENVVNRKDSPETRKKLGDLYAVANDYEKALENYNIAAELANAFDPDLDKAISEITAGQFDASIAEWQHYLAGGNLSDEEVEEAEDQIASLRGQKAETLIGRAKERVQRQPHAVGERIKLGKICWMFGYYNEAISEFNQTQSSTLR